MAWIAQASCLGTEHPNDFFTEYGSRSRPPQDELASPSRLLPLLVCRGCPVRVPCLREGLRTWRFARTGDQGAAPEVTRVESDGTWGGTHREDRQAVAHLPVDEQVRVLEATLEDRLRRRIDAWQERRQERMSERRRAGLAPVMHRRERMILTMLEGDEVRAAG